MSPNQHEEDDMDLRISLARVEEKLNGVVELLRNLDKDVKYNYVRRAEFEPVKKAVYGLISCILIAVVGGMLGLILK